MCKERQFNGIKDASSWRVDTRQYMFSAAHEMQWLLDLVEQNEHRPATREVLRVATSHWLAESQLRYLSHELWSFLRLNLVDQAKAIFAKVLIFEGFEAWRCVMRPVRSRNEVRRMEVHRVVQQPEEA